MKKILIQLDSDKFASVFDTVTAYDAGGHLISFKNLVRKGEENEKHTYLF
jgi:hypothetical protein